MNFLLSRGFGIVEVLVASSLGILVGMFALDTLGVAVRTTQTTKTALEEQTFSLKMSQFLSQEANCKYILKPTQLPDSEKQKGLLNAEDIKTLIGFKQDLIEIQGIELLNEGTDKTYPQRTFTVFYTKPFVKGKETLEGEECDPANGEKAGCYFQTCSIDYKCDEDDCNGLDDKCQAVSCQEGVTALTQNLILNKIRSLCKVGEVLTYETLGGIKQKRCRPLLNFSPDPDNPGIRCPPGKIVKVIKANGELECDWPKLCRVEQYWNNIFEKCELCPEERDVNRQTGQCCPSDKPRYFGTSCHRSCYPGFIETSDKRCVCPAGQANWIRFTGGNGECKSACPDNATTYIVNDDRVCDCNPGFYRSGSWHNSAPMKFICCKKKASSYLPESRLPLSERRWHNSGGKCCPSGHWNSNGKCCPSGHWNSNGICCPNDKKNVYGKCCRKDRVQEEGNQGCCAKKYFIFYTRRGDDIYGTVSKDTAPTGAIAKQVYQGQALFVINQNEGQCKCTAGSHMQWGKCVPNPNPLICLNNNENCQDIIPERLIQRIISAVHGYLE